MTPLPLSELFEQWQWQLDGWWLRQSERQPWIRLLSQHLNQWLDWLAWTGAAQPWHPFAVAQEARHLMHVVAARAVAPPVATTPCRVTPLVGQSQLRYYPPTQSSGSAATPPVLIINSLINRYYIFDLYAGRSFVAFLAGRGHHVFVLDWGTPGKDESRWRLEDVLENVIGCAVETVLSHAGTAHVHLLGYSMGGVLATTYAALHPPSVRSLILLGTPADFARDTPLRTWLADPAFDPQRLAAIFGNLPGWLVSASFRSIKPVSYATKPWLIWLDAAERDTHLAMEVWLADAVPLPGQFYADFVTAYYRANALWEGRLTIRGQRAALSQLNCPVLNIFGLLDQIVNPTSAAALGEQLTHAHYQECRVQLGHLALVVGRGAVTTVWPTITQWLDTH